MELHGVAREPRPDDRGVLLRSLVRLGTVSNPEEFAATSASTRGGRSSSTRARRTSSRPGSLVRAAVGRRAPGGRGHDRGGRHSRPAAPVTPRRGGRASSVSRGLVVWPPAGQEPIDRGSRQNYFDSLYHAERSWDQHQRADRGGDPRPAGAHVLDDEFAETQKGTLHFHYLRTRISATWSSPGRSTSTAAACGIPSRRGRPGSGCARFVRRFVRPHGLEPAATADLSSSRSRSSARSAGGAPPGS